MEKLADTFKRIKAIFLDNSFLFTLHLGVGNGDIQKREFKTLRDMCAFVHGVLGQHPIWIITGVPIDWEPYEVEVFVTDEKEYCSEVYIPIIALDCSEVFLQGYNSFEDAYLVAKDMREIHPLCYS